MPDHRRRPNLISLAALALVALAPAAAPAQSSQTARDRDARRMDLEMRQRALRDLDRRPNKKPAQAPDTRPAYNEVAEEFRQLQLVNYSLAGVADQKVPLDFARVKKESAEVRKRASRLKTYLSLPEVDQDGRREKAEEIRTPEALRAAVGRLDALVNSFAWNPVFQKPGVVDLEQSAKAGRDLAAILGLSERIRKSAEELGRSVARQ